MSISSMELGELLIAACLDGSLVNVQELHGEGLGAMQPSTQTLKGEGVPLDYLDGTPHRAACMPGHIQIVFYLVIGVTGH